MFKKREKVVYPRLGAGKIVDVFDQKVGEEVKKYYKIEFFDSNVTVSVPVETSEEMGLRYPLKKTAAIKVMKDLRKRVKITRNTLTTLDEVAKNNLRSGKLEDAIDLVNLLTSLAHQKEQENKNFSYSASQRLETALNFIKSEIEMVLGKKAAEKYNLSLR